MSEYVDYAEYYDFDHDTKIDLEFYLEFANQCRSPILELACGTGLLAIPIAEAGFEIYGLDLSANMLARCRTKVERKNLTDSVHLSLANITEFDLPRVDFTHWVLVDLAADRNEIAEGTFSSGVTARGKSGPEGPDGTRQGVNDYTGWFAGDADMVGDYYGYDGPCPPWNDSIVHHYHFTLYALDIPRCPIEKRFDRSQVLEAIDGHVLGQASLMGTYSLNPKAP